MGDRSSPAPPSSTAAARRAARKRTAAQEQDTPARGSPRPPPRQGGTYGGGAGGRRDAGRAPESAPGGHATAQWHRGVSCRSPFCCERRGKYVRPMRMTTSPYDLVRRQLIRRAGEVTLKPIAMILASRRRCLALRVLPGILAALSGRPCDLLSYSVMLAAQHPSSSLPTRQHAHAAGLPRIDDEVHPPGLVGQSAPSCPQGGEASGFTFPTPRREAAADFQLACWRGRASSSSAAQGGRGGLSFALFVWCLRRSTRVSTIAVPAHHRQRLVPEVRATPVAVFRASSEPSEALGCGKRSRFPHPCNRSRCGTQHAQRPRISTACRGTAGSSCAHRELTLAGPPDSKAAPMLTTI